MVAGRQLYKQLYTSELGPCSWNSSSSSASSLFIFCIISSVSSAPYSSFQFPSLLIASISFSSPSSNVFLLLHLLFTQPPPSLAASSLLTYMLLPLTPLSRLLYLTLLSSFPFTFFLHLLFLLVFTFLLFFCLIFFILVYLLPLLLLSRSSFAFSFDFSKKKPVLTISKW